MLNIVRYFLRHPAICFPDSGNRVFSRKSRKVGYPKLSTLCPVFRQIHGVDYQKITKMSDIAKKLDGVDEETLKKVLELLKSA